MKNYNYSWIRDLLAGLIFLAISIAGIIHTYTLRQVASAPPIADAGLYTRFVLGVLILLSVLLIIRALINKKTNLLSSIANVRVLAVLLLLFSYVILMPIIGYRISTIIFLFITISVLSYFNKSVRFYNNEASLKQNLKNNLKQNGRELLKYLLTAIITAVIVEQLFVQLLAVRLP